MGEGGRQALHCLHAGDGREEGEEEPAAGEAGSEASPGSEHGQQDHRGQTGAVPDRSEFGPHRPGQHPASIRPKWVKKPKQGEDAETGVKAEKKKGWWVVREEHVHTHLAPLLDNRPLE